jgi:hypothetical protein
MNTTQEMGRKKTSGGIDFDYGNRIIGEKSTNPSIHSSNDMNDWVKLFMATYKKLDKDTSQSEFEEFLFTWFCNIQMNGYDWAHSKRDKDYIYILMNGAIIHKIFHYEPDENELKWIIKKELRIDVLSSDIGHTNFKLYRWRKFGNEKIQCANKLTTGKSDYNWVVEEFPELYTTPCATTNCGTDTAYCGEAQERKVKLGNDKVTRVDTAEFLDILSKKEDDL